MWKQSSLPYLRAQESPWLSSFRNCLAVALQLLQLGLLLLLLLLGTLTTFTAPLVHQTPSAVFQDASADVRIAKAITVLIEGVAQDSNLLIGGHPVSEFQISPARPKAKRKVVLNSDCEWFIRLFQLIFSFLLRRHQQQEHPDTEHQGNDCLYYPWRNFQQLSAF